MGLALLASVGSTGCAHDETKKEQAVERGTLQMALETISDSGKIYRLRQAVFPVESIDGRGTSATLRSEDDPSNPVIETFLTPGQFAITLLPGWFMEQEDRLLHTVGTVDAKLHSETQ